MATPKADPKNTRQEDQVSSKFGSILSTAFGIYKKNPLAFMGFYLLPIVLSVLLQLGVYGLTGIQLFLNQQFGLANAITAFVVGMIIAGLLGWIIQLITKNASLRGAYKADTEGKVPFGECFSAGVNKLGKAIGLSIRIFVYTRIWLLIILICLVPLFAYLTKLATQYSNDQLMAVMAQVNAVPWLLPLVILVVFILLIGRFLKVVFSFPVLMSKDVTSKEALQESIALAKDRLGRIFGNYFLYGLLVGFVTVIFQQVFAQIVGLFLATPDTMVARVENLKYVMLFSGIIPALLVGSFTSVFNYAFMRNMRIEKEGK